MMRSAHSITVFVALLGGGCNLRTPATNTGAQQPTKPQASTRADREADKTAKSNTAKRGRRPLQELDENWLPPLPTAGSTSVVGAARANWSGGPAFTESQAIGLIEREIKDALEVRPTLVVWLFDQSRAAGTMRRALASAAVQMPSRLTGDARADKSSDQAPHKLITAVVSFGDKVNVLTPEPVEDPAKLPGPDIIAEEPAPASQAYAAVNKAAELFAVYRMRGHEVIFVLVAQSAVADENNFKTAAGSLSKARIPVFGIGPAAPFGRLPDTMTAAIKPLDPSIGHESLLPERIGLFFPNNQGDSELSDSGYGPFHLERICRATEGRFLRIRPGGSAGWATDDSGEIKPELLRKYAPDYVNEAEYKKILAENRACMALHQAAQLPPSHVLIAPTYDFRKQDEAAMARALTMAQRASAENQEVLERLQQTLAAGEPDRAKLTPLRWQAAFDLAYGRACAARARNEGYNQMLAVLKNGKAFSKPDSTAWSLKPADGIAGRSELDKMAKNAKTYLERVIKEHAGTPWAAMAERELETPCGWEWTER